MIPAFWMDVPSLTGQPIWMFFGRRAEDCGYPPAHHRRRFLSTRVHQVQPCCHILQLSFWSALIHPRSDSWYLCNLCVHSFKWLLACSLLPSLPFYRASLEQPNIWLVDVLLWILLLFCSEILHSLVPNSSWKQQYQISCWLPSFLTMSLNCSLNCHYC